MQNLQYMVDFQWLRFPKGFWDIVRQPERQMNNWWQSKQVEGGFSSHHSQGLIKIYTPKLAKKKVCHKLYQHKFLVKTTGRQNCYLVGGWTNPFEKYLSNWIISPGRGEKKIYLKPPPSYLFSSWTSFMPPPMDTFHSIQHQSQLWSEGSPLSTTTITTTTTTSSTTVDGWNPANQLRLVVFPIIYRVSAPSQVVIAGFKPSTVPLLPLLLLQYHHNQVLSHFKFQDTEGSHRSAARSNRFSSAFRWQLNPVWNGGRIWLGETGFTRPLFSGRMWWNKPHLFALVLSLGMLHWWGPHLPTNLHKPSTYLKKITNKWMIHVLILQSSSWLSNPPPETKCFASNSATFSSSCWCLCDLNSSFTSKKAGRFCSFFFSKTLSSVQVNRSPDQKWINDLLRPFKILQKQGGYETSMLKGG